MRLPESHEVRIPLPTLFSDALYRTFHMSQISLAPFVTKIPLQNQIHRFANLTAGEFNTGYANTPFILTEPVKTWPAYKQWTYKKLVAKYGDVKFRAESVDWRLADYVDYMENQSDESPLYLFDRSYCEKMAPEAEAAFTAPECFGKDFFEVLGDDRPDRRWLILGPERSGSTFHKVRTLPMRRMCILMNCRTPTPPRRGTPSLKGKSTGSCSRPTRRRRECLCLMT